MKVKMDQSGDGLTVGDYHYTCTIGPIHALDTDPLRISFGWEPSTTCHNCPCGVEHEIPGAERVATSVEEAVAQGWLTEDPGQ